MCQPTDYSTWVAIVISVSAVGIALYVGYYTISLQVVTAIQDKLTNKAKECNRFINPIDQRFPLQTQDVSAVVSSILYAKHILDLQFQTYKTFLRYHEKQEFIDLFYLELHTSISEYTHRNQIELIPDNATLRPIINQQLNECHDLLEASDLKFRFIYTAK
ncbi:hypothetical protein [Flavobacterium sp. UBA6046]|uniref:hypothetical protein n=1 Tax=Flavobacterium sp. UBA6046 TaxID=1946552 RepID=UPI0025B973DB|nr:hypothetical protein [Flavobacterium sp. UBA6046]